MGDVGREDESMKREVIEVGLNDDMVAVVGVVYCGE